MEQETTNAKSSERGCLLSGVLITQLLIMGIAALLMISLLVSAFTANPIDWALVGGKTLPVLVTAVLTIIAIIGVFKMKKKWGYVLLVTILLSVVFFVYTIFEKGNPYAANLTEQQQSGVGLSMLMCVYNIFCVVIIALGLKKMK